MLIIQTLDDLHGYIGKTLGVSDWLLIDQAKIDLFAKATGDNQWIHVDAERAVREMPGGKTIAHGFLILSLVGQLAATIYKVENRKRGLNYGMNKVRFTKPVPAGARIRMHLSVKEIERQGGGHRVMMENVVELEGEDVTKGGRPAMVAETIGLWFDK